METLSPSRINCMTTCNRKHYWDYEVGLEPIEKAQALRFGGAFHRALAARAQGADYEAALKAGIGDVKELQELDVAILAALLAGYYETYKVETIAKMHPEIEVKVAIEGNRSFEGHCVLDGLAELTDGRMAIAEHKTTSESLEADSQYWEALRFNVQVALYVEAARVSGWQTETVLYDVIKKPSIRQKQTETVEQYADRLRQDVKDRPAFYYARKELPVLDSDVEEMKAMRDAVARQIVAARKEEKRYAKPEYAWPRCVGRFNCQMCQFNGFCLQGLSASRENIPSGFKIKVK